MKALVFIFVCGGLAICGGGSLAAADLAVGHSGEQGAARSADDRQRVDALPLRLAALSAVESGGDDAAVGRAGEVSRFQITVAVWHEFTRLPVAAARNPVTSASVAAAIMKVRVARFVKRLHREPNDFEFYILWSRPARVLADDRQHVRAVERERASRFAAVVQEFLTTEPVTGIKNFSHGLNTDFRTARPEVGALPFITNP